MDARTPDLWERQPGESDEAWGRFVLYRDHGLPRPRAKVAEMLGISEVALDTMARRRDWIARVRAWDAEVQRRADRAALDDAEQRQRQHLKIARLMQFHGAQAVLEGERPSAAEGGRLAVEGVRMERLIIGSATERTETMSTSMLALTDEHLEVLTDEERALWRRLVEKMAQSIGDDEPV